MKRLESSLWVGKFLNIVLPLWMALLLFNLAPEKAKAFYQSSGPTSISWKKIPCSGLPSQPCPTGQGFSTIVPDPVNHGVLVYTTREASKGTVSTNGTAVSWASGDLFGNTWALAAGDNITINSVVYTIVQNSVTSTALTLTSSAGVQASAAYLTNPGGLTMSTAFYDYYPANHSWSQPFYGSHSTIANLSGNLETDDPMVENWPADRQQTQGQFYDPSRQSVWLVGGVNGGKIWNCSTNGTANCNAGFGSQFKQTTWIGKIGSSGSGSMPVPQKGIAWTGLTPTNFPVNSGGEVNYAIDPDDQVVIGVGAKSPGGTWATQVFFRTNLNPTPGTCTADQNSAGCSTGGIGPDNWGIVTTSGSTVPDFAYPGVQYSYLTKAFYVLDLLGTGAGTLYKYAPLTKTYSIVGGSCTFNVTNLPGGAIGYPAFTVLGNGKLLYHYYPATGAGTDTLYDPVGDSCTTLANTGGGPSLANDTPAWGASLTYDIGTDRVIAWPQGGNFIWEGQLNDTPPTMQSGSGAPSAGTGNEGDLYHRTDTDAIYGPKTGGQWPATFSYIVSKGCTTAYHIDKDCDAYGVGITIGGVTTDPNPLVARDADDSDVTVQTTAQAITKYGSMNGFLTHLGYPTNRVFYIDPVNGSDSNSGTVGSPYQHWDAIGTTMHDGAGGTVIYRASASAGIGICQFSGPCYNPTATSSSSPVAFIAYPGEQVVFNTYGGLSASSSYGFQNNVIYDGIILTNPLDAGAAFAGDHMQGITFKNMEWSSFGMGWQIGEGAIDITTDNNLFHDIDEHIVYPTTFLYSTSLFTCPGTWVSDPSVSDPFVNLVITNNLVINSGDGGFEPIHMNSIICGGLISNNVIWGSGGTPIGLYTGVQDLTVSNNVIWSGSSAGITLFTYGCDNNDMVPTSMQLANECGGWGSTLYVPNMLNNVKIVNNTIWTGSNAPVCTGRVACAVPTYGITVSGSAAGTPGNRWIKNTTIQNNLILTYNDGTGFQQFRMDLQSYPETDTIKNNMLYNLYAGHSDGFVMHIIGVADCLANNSPWFGYGATFCTGAGTGSGVFAASSFPGSFSFTQFQSYNTGNNSGNLFNDPLFTDVALGYTATPQLFNFRLTGSSPALGAGLATGAPTTDIMGFGRPSPPSIGAYELSDTVVATPTDSPGMGTYSSAQTVTLSDATSGATICYTTDGSTPAATTPGTCSTGTTYSSGFSVSSTTTVKAIGTKSGLTNSGVLTSVYTITGASVGSKLSSGVKLSGGVAIR